MPRGIVTLVHLSDVHLGPLPPVPLRLLNAKRAAGVLNWYRKRRHVHLPDIAARLARDAVALGADHVAVSGDLANVGLPAEIARAALWLGQLGAPDRVSVVPGNHDIYSTVHGQRLGVAALDPWRPHFQSCAQGQRYVDDQPFPFVRIIGNDELRIALIGLNSAVETPPMVATGSLGGAQMAQLGRILDATAHDGLVRVVMLHHPPLPGLARPHHDLIDAAMLHDTLARHGAELVIHGHNHRRMVSTCIGGRDPIPCIGVASASAGRSQGNEPLAQLHVYQFERGNDGPRPAITLIARGLIDPAGPVVELERIVL